MSTLTRSCLHCGDWVETPGTVCLTCWLDEWRAYLVRQDDGTWVAEALQPSARSDGASDG